jgi:hypothetical protein
LDRAARKRRGARALCRRPSGDDRLRRARRPHRRGNLRRTRGSVGWLAFYSIFVLAAAVHAPIGLRPVLGEWLKWRGQSREVFVLFFGFALAWLGMRAVLSVFA